MSQAKWEYLTETTSDVERMNALGKEGWEAFAAVNVFGSTPDSMLRVLYKRPKGKDDDCKSKTKVTVEVGNGS